MTALRQIERLGFDAADVRHIVLTHLDFDHAGGLDDFPDAQVHLLRQERDDALPQKTWLDRQRFRPQQWSQPRAWHVYRRRGGERWFGFDGVRELHGLPPEIAAGAAARAHARPCRRRGAARRALAAARRRRLLLPCARWIPSGRAARRACACTRR